MATPYVPEDFRRLIIQEDDSLCTALKNLTQLSVMWWQMIRFKYRPDGNGFTEEYIAMLEAALAECPDPAVEFDGITPNPQDFKNVLVSSTSIFCEKFVRLSSGLSQLIYNYIAFEYNSTGTGFTEEYMALLCGVDCGDEEVIDVNSILNYHDFIKWDVVQGEVDIIGIAPYDPVEGASGMYLDLHGTSGRPRSNGEAANADVRFGAIRTKALIPITAGKEYTIKYKLAGQNITESFAPGTVLVRLLKEDLTQYESVTASHTPAAWNSGFVEQTVSFTAGSTAGCYLQLESTDALAGPSHPSNNNVGPKIDDVLVTNVTDDMVIFTDDFEFEVEGANPYEFETPDPDDSKAAIPVATLEVCAKFAKIVIDFPQNVYDVISYEFNPAGSGFNPPYKFLICNPVVEEEDEENNGLLNGLQAYYKFDEGSGDALDSSGFGRDLTENGTVANLSPGMLETARYHDSSDDTDYLSVASADWNTFGAGDFTISLWAKLQESDGETQDQVLVAKCDSIDGASWVVELDKGLSYDYSYALWLSVSEDGGFGSLLTPVVSLPLTEPLDSDKWYFICVRRSGNTVTLFYYPENDPDAMRTATGTFAGTLYDNSTVPLTVGTLLASGSPDPNFDVEGGIDEMGIWKRALTDVQIGLLKDKLPLASFTYA
jgi:hypothetical protein